MERCRRCLNLASAPLDQERTLRAVVLFDGPSATNGIGANGPPGGERAQRFPSRRLDPRHPGRPAFPLPHRGTPLAPPSNGPFPGFQNKPGFPLPCGGSPPPSRAQAPSGGARAMTAQDAHWVTGTGETRLTPLPRNPERLLVFAAEDVHLALKTSATAAGKEGRTLTGTHTRPPPLTCAALGAVQEPGHMMAAFKAAYQTPGSSETQGPAFVAPPATTYRGLGNRLSTMHRHCSYQIRGGMAAGCSSAVKMRLVVVCASPHPSACTSFRNRAVTRRQPL